MNEQVINAELFVDRLIRLAHEFPGQPVAVIEDNGGLKVGVMSLLDPIADDWCLTPVPLANLASAERQDTDNHS